MSQHQATQPACSRPGENTAYTHNPWWRCLLSVAATPVWPPAAQQDQRAQPSHTCAAPAPNTCSDSRSHCSCQGPAQELWDHHSAASGSTCKALQKLYVCFCSFLSAFFWFPVFQREFQSFVQDKSNHLTHSYSSESEEVTDLRLSRLTRCLQSQAGVCSQCKTQPSPAFFQYSFFIKLSSPFCPSSKPCVFLCSQ